MSDRNLSIGVAVASAAAAAIGLSLVRYRRQRREREAEQPYEGVIIFLYSTDLRASRRFYEHDLGLSLRSDKGAVVFYRLPSHPPGASTSSLGIVQAGVSAAEAPPCSAATAGRDTVMLCLLAADVDAAFERVVGGGRAAVVQPPRTNQRFGIYNALVRDPDGYLVELQQFLSPSEQQLFAPRRDCG